jgi:hypothetical protein
LGFLEVLCLLFVVLKLVGVITWSWWLVFAPLYPAVLVWFGIALWIGTILWDEKR